MPKNKPSAKPKAALAKQMSAQAKLTHTPGTKRVLHIEVGATKTQMHKHLSGSEWKTLTLNIDKKTPADFHLYPTNLSQIPDETFDAVWSNHTMKFFYTTDLPYIFKEIHRVLKKDGVFIMAAHNLKRIADTLRIKGVDAALYETKAGPVSVLDVLYGFRKYLQNDDKEFVVPKTGFSTGFVANLFKHSGFLNISVVEEGITLSAVGYKREKKTDANSKVSFTPVDMNKVMADRDKMDIPPTPVAGTPVPKD